MKFRKNSMVLFMLLLFAACQATITNKPTQTAFPSMAGLADEGAFGIYYNEERIATTTFSWKVNGSYESGTTMTFADQSVYYSVNIEVDETGQWTNLHVQSPIGPLTVLNKKDKATVLNVGVNPALLSMAIRAYDQAKAGRQTIQIFYVPGKEVVETGMTRLDPVEGLVKGNLLKLTPYFFENRNGEFTIYTDTSGRVILVERPHEYMTSVRKGYEELLQMKKPELNVSAVQYEIVKEKNVMIPMRDGVGLATDIYMPKAEGPWPIILRRTPYGKEKVEISLQACFYARRGYVFAVQDSRGRFSSQGIWEPFFNEARDGYDAIEWLAMQPWSSGKVGMIGLSYDGWVQWWAARERPPHLTTIIPNCSQSDPYLCSYGFGCFASSGIKWVDEVENEVNVDFSGRLLKISNDKNWALLRDLPVIDLDKKILGHEVSYWRTWINHPDLDSYWASLSILDHIENIRIPVFQQSGWFDPCLLGSKLNYLKMKSYGHQNQKLTIGPWGHTNTASRSFEGHDFGKKAWIDLQRDYLRWFDFWLKGMANGIDHEPLVSIFVMGVNKWLKGDIYPLPGTQMTKLYLGGNGQANASRGECLLTFEQPSAENSTDGFIYDPADPTPDRLSWIREKADDQRSDILVYQTEPLKKPLTLAGPLSAVLYAASSAKDTDWFMRVCVVDPNGKIFFMTQGKIRARYRNSFEKPELLKPGEIYAYNLDLWHTAIQIPVNGRLRVEVTSASFPDFSRNLNTGGHNETETEYVKAEQTIYHDAAHPSYILLPIINME